ncbi:MAG: Gfo/Idh/MocA family protein [Planctomycetota bacterium]|jgi:predicted dehydrogenase
MPRKRYAVVGVGGRSRMYVRAITGKYAESAELVAICDNNKGRLDYANERLTADGHDAVAAYADTDFDRMVAERKPDTVVVTTRDCFHDVYVCRAMELGVDAVTEKPMTTDHEKCQRILDTKAKTGRSVRVTFNYRYSPPRTQVKDMLMDGVIGRILSVDFNWQLSTGHGADYFRRWHRNKRNSGGLMVHKATHHFDLVNWWLSSRPVEVYAAGARNFYTPATAERYGLTGRGERCHGCAESEKCKFFLDLAASERLRKLYLDVEQHDGYFRDRCVFAEDIDIEDSMNLAVRYASGAFMSYSLNAFCPKEGYTVTLNGSRGRLEHRCLETSYISGQEGSQVHETIRKGSSTWVYPHFGSPYEVDLWTAKGGHGGGDDPLLEGIFSPDPPEDKYLRAADQVQGAWSILTGIAANESMRTGEPVKTDSLVTGLAEPVFPEMPEW